MQQQASEFKSIKVSKFEQESAATAVYGQWKDNSPPSKELLNSEVNNSTNNTNPASSLLSLPRKPKPPLKVSAPLTAGVQSQARREPHANPDAHHRREQGGDIGNAAGLGLLLDLLGELRRHASEEQAQGCSKLDSLALPTQEQEPHQAPASKEVGADPVHQVLA